MTNCPFIIWPFLLHNWNSLLIGIVGSIVASLLLLAGQCLDATRKRRKKAEPFVGFYEMTNVSDKPFGGTVAIAPLGRIAWLSSDVLLSVIARHSSGAVDWTAVVEVLGYSRMAEGFFEYEANHRGGALRLMLSKDGQEITEHGTPHDGTPFTNLFKRTK